MIRFLKIIFLYTDRIDYSDFPKISKKLYRVDYALANTTRFSWNVPLFMTLALYLFLGSIAVAIIFHAIPSRPIWLLYAALFGIPFLLLYPHLIILLYRIWKQRNDLPKGFPTIINLQNDKN